MTGKSSLSSVEKKIHQWAPLWSGHRSEGGDDRRLVFCNYWSWSQSKQTQIQKFGRPRWKLVNKMELSQKMVEHLPPMSNKSGKNLHKTRNIQSTKMGRIRCWAVMIAGGPPQIWVDQRWSEGIRGDLVDEDDCRESSKVWKMTRRGLWYHIKPNRKSYETDFDRTLWILSLSFLSLDDCSSKYI